LGNFLDVKIIFSAKKMSNFAFDMAKQDQSIQQTQSLGLRLSAQQLRFVKLLEYNAPELEEAVARELEDNPALQQVDPPGQVEVLPAHEDLPRHYAAYASSAPVFDYDEHRDESSETLYSSLESQLSDCRLSPIEEDVARYVIGSLDPDGYLRRSVANLVDDLAFGPGIDVSPAQVNRAIDAVKSLDPAGVGASDLPEALRLQLVRMEPGQTRDDALDIIDNEFDAFMKRHTHKIMSGLRISQERALAAIDLITTLNPKPGNIFSSPEDRLDVIVPDFVVTNDDGQLTISVNNSIPELRIEQGFEEAVKELQQTPPDRRRNVEMKYVTSRYDDARDFMRLLSQRQQTMKKVMTAIVDIQKEYFLTEDVYRMRPMMIKDITSRTGLDASTISRATANKYVSTPWGIFPLRHFFSDTVGEESAEVVTNRQIEAAISEIIGSEDKRHPLSDDKIQKILESKGYNISRRTVNKYRDRKGIPPARLRKSL